MIKILHLGDIHLGYSYRSKENAMRFLLEGSIEKSFENAVNFSIDNDIDLFIIAGDLFDFGPIGPRNFDFFINMVRKLKSHDINIAYALGNHDNLTLIQVNLMTIIRSELIVFDKLEHRSVTLKSKDGDTYNVHGVGHEFDKVDKNLILNYPISKKDGSYDIGIAHCFVESVASSSEYDRYLPTSYEDLKSRQYDYFALGHIHLPSIYKDSNIAYSGSLQALNFKEEGPRGGNYIEIDKYGTSIRHINLTTKTYQSVNVSLSNNLKDHLELMKVIRDEVDKKLSNYNFKNTLVRLIFSGSVSKEIIDLLDNDKKYLSEQISLNLGCDYIEIDIEDVKLNYNSENILSKDHFLGYSLEKFDYDINEVKDKLLKELSFSGVDMKNIDIDKKVNEVRDMILESLLKR